MKRRVIKQANQAFTITLPIDWARKNNLEKNPEINIEILEKTLIISTTNKTLGGKTKINADNLSKKSIYRIILALYAKGIDEIEITSSKNLDHEILSCLNALIGYALVDQKDSTYIIRDLNASSDANLDDIFKRVFQMILMLYDAAYKDILVEKKETSETLKSRDLEVNKFCYYLQRSINKSSYGDPINGRTLFTYAFALETLSDNIERMWRFTLDNKLKSPKLISEILLTSKDAVSQAFDLYFSFNLKKLDEVHLLRDKTKGKIALLKADPITVRVAQDAVKIAEQAADLTQLTLMRNIKENQ